jgi:hypothetical protein
MTHVAVHDDYQNVALQMADWRTLPSDCHLQVFNDQRRACSCLEPGGHGNGSCENARKG